MISEFYLLSCIVIALVTYFSSYPQHSVVTPLPPVSSNSLSDDCQSWWRLPGAFVAKALKKKRKAIVQINSKKGSFKSWKKNFYIGKYTGRLGEMVSLDACWD